MMLMLYVPQWEMRSDDVFCFELEEAQCTREVKVRGFVALDERVGIVMREELGASVIETWRAVDVDLIREQGHHCFAAVKLRKTPQTRPTALRNTIRFSTGINAKLTIDANGQIL
jgi:hypothetical protein